ncbi:MAG TPA: EamA family transporter [Gaiellaceae bacterium]|nr:EamA family transporter [Gaiellaceae bacterium]
MSRRAKVWIALWIVYVIWGSTYLGIELAGETMPGLFAAGVRFTLAGLLMLGFIAWRRGGGALRATRAELLSASVVGLLLPGANSLLFVTEQHVPIGLTSLIIAAVPLWVLLLRLAARERPDLVSSIGLVVGFGGIVLLVKPGGGSGSLGYLLLTVAASFMWALGSFLAPRIPVPRDALVATGYEMLAGGLVLLVVGLVAYSPSQLDPSGWSARSLFGLVYLIVLGSIVGYSAYAWLLANAPIGQVSTYAYVNPVVAIALGVIVLDESLTLRIVGGALLILLSVAIVLRRESRAAATLEPGEVLRADRHAGELAPARRA